MKSRGQCPQILADSVCCVSMLGCWKSVWLDHEGILKIWSDFGKWLKQNFSSPPHMYIDSYIYTTYINTCTYHRNKNMYLKSYIDRSQNLIDNLILKKGHFMKLLVYIINFLIYSDPVLVQDSWKIILHKYLLTSSHFIGNDKMKLIWAETTIKQQKIKSKNNIKF